VVQAGPPTRRSGEAATSAGQGEVRPRRPQGCAGQGRAVYGADGTFLSCRPPPLHLYPDRRRTGV